MRRRARWWPRSSSSARRPRPASSRSIAARTASGAVAASRAVGAALAAAAPSRAAACVKNQHVSEVLPRHRADAITGTTARRWRGAVKFDYHTGRREDGEADGGDVREHVGRRARAGARPLRRRQRRRRVLERVQRPPQRLGRVRVEDLAKRHRDRLAHRVRARGGLLRGAAPRVRLGGVARHLGRAARRAPQQLVGLGRVRQLPQLARGAGGACPRPRRRLGRHHGAAAQRRPAAVSRQLLQRSRGAQHRQGEAEAHDHPWINAG